MNDDPLNMPAELTDLLSDLTDGKLDDEAYARLRQLLSDDPAMFDLYCKWMHLDAMLYLDLQHSRDALFMPPLTPRSLLEWPRGKYRLLSPAARRWAMGLTAVAATAIALSLVYVKAVSPEQVNSPQTVVKHSEVKFRTTPDKIAAFHHTTGNTVAVLSRSADAAQSGGKPLVAGSPVSAGKFVVDSGLVQLEFLCGANIVVEGPAELELVSTMLVVCRSGKLRARVPAQAKGFMVDTPHHRTVDLGTEFGVSVATDSSTEVHVIEGEVEMFDINRGDVPAAVRSRDLKIGHGLRTLADGSNEPIVAEPAKFIGVEQLLSRSTQDSLSQLSVWRNQSERWRSGEDVVAYYSFEHHEPWSRVLHNDGFSKAANLEGAIVGCRWSDGRWPGKHALEFKGTEDRVRLDIPGEFESISLACWIRIGGFDRWLSSILLTDGHNLGEVHWQFTETGQLLLGVKAEPEQSQDYLSETVLQPTDVGRWIHLACVYNNAKKEVVHFVDGNRVSTHPIVREIPLRFGPAEIGNWVPEELKDHRIRSLNGQIDEFLLLNRSMTDDEVREMFNSGSPNT